MRVEPLLDLEHELAATVAVDRGHREHRPLPRVGPDERAHALLALVLGNEVDLVQHEPARLLQQRRIVAAELRDDGPCVADRIGVRIERRDVDDMEQHARALQVAQELVAETCTVGRSFDEAGDVGDDEAAPVVDADDAEIRRECGERIVGDFGPRGRYRADERALAGVRHAEEAHVGQHPELEMQPPLLACFAGRRLARRPVRARLEVNVAETARAALRDAHLLQVGREIGDELAGVGVGDHRADGHAQHDVFGAAAVLVGAVTVLAVLRAMDARIAVFDQRVDVAIGDRDDAAAAPAVAAVGSAARHVLLAPERGRSVAAVAGDDVDVDFVDESHGAFRT